MLQTPAAIACGGCNIQSHFFTGAACTQSQIFIRSVAAARRPVFSKRSHYPLSTLLRMGRKKEKSIFLKGVNKIYLSPFNGSLHPENSLWVPSAESLKRARLSLPAAFLASATHFAPEKQTLLGFHLPNLGQIRKHAMGKGKICSSNK